MRTISQIFSGLVLLLVLLINEAHGETPLSLTPGTTIGASEIEQNAKYLLADRGAISVEDILLGQAPAFQKLAGQSVDFGYTKSQIWLRLDVRNSTSERLDQFLVLHARFMHFLRVYIVQDGQTTVLLKDGEHLPFTQRPIDYRNLATPLSLDANEKATVYITFWSNGATEMPISVETTESFYRLKYGADLRNFTIYAAGAAMIFFTLLSMGVMRWRVHLAYALYFGSVLLFLAHTKGYTFQHIWPHWPEWNAYGSLSLGYGLSITGAIFTITVLDLRRYHPMAYKAALILIVVSALIICTGPLFDTAQLKRFGFIFNSLTIVFLIYCGVLAALRRQPGAKFFVAGWLALFIAGSLSSITHWISSAFSVQDTHDFISIAVLFEAGMLSLAINRQAAVLRRQNQDAMQRELIMTQDLLSAEREKSEAMIRAEKQRLQLAQASHDVQQPLLSLRAALSRESPAGKPPEEIQSSISYLEGLIGQFLTNTRPHETVETQSAEIASYPVTKVWQHLKTMFNDEAIAKGIQLSCVPSSYEIKTEPMAVFRIMSNLVSNAIRHSDGDRIVAGCRRVSGGVELQVWDNGAGIAPAEITVLRKRYSKAPQSDGEGLGLAIIDELATEFGLQFRIKSWLGNGSRFALFLPD
ncbi:MAG: sensor histidine kinase [Pseudomonadota bacterium]